MGEPRHPVIRAANEPRYPYVHVTLSGQDGNALVIVGRIRNALRLAGVPAPEREKFTSEALSGDYGRVLQTAMEWVDVS